MAKVFIFTGLRTRRPYFSLLAKKKKDIYFPEIVNFFRNFLDRTGSMF